MVAVVDVDAVASADVDSSVPVGDVVLGAAVVGEVVDRGAVVVVGLPAPALKKPMSKV